jgi:cell wall-associated NlpC family hydrolase
MGKPSSQKREILRERIVAFAEKFVGTPYKYGASASEAPKVFDCSGFVQYVFKHFGFEIPRSTILQAEFAGKIVKSVKSIEPGDLIFFRGISGHYNKKFPKGVGHVILYLGKEKVIHSDSKRLRTYPKIVEKGSVKIESLKDIIRKSKPLVVIKRVI